MLIGKGVCAVYGNEIDLTIRMAQAIDATHVLFRTGRGTDYFESTARTALRKIKDAGFVPFAWPFIFCDDPAGEAQVAVRAWQEGYEASSSTSRINRQARVPMLPSWDAGSLKTQGWIPTTCTSPPSPTSPTIPEFPTRRWRPSARAASCPSVMAPSAGPLAMSWTL